MSIPDRPRPLTLNVRALVVVLTVVVLGLIGTTWLWFARGGGGLSFLEYGRSLHEQGQDDLALQYLFAYLEERPRDLEALTLTGQLLTERAWSIRDLDRAIGIYDRILRTEPDPRSARALEARRQLVRLHLAVGPYLPRMMTRYQTADILAAQLLELGGPDPTALRLRGLVKLQLSALGDDRELPESVALFEQARALEPGEVEGALPLARTYRDHQKDLPRALDVVDTMVQANDSIEARLQQYHFLDETARDLRSRSDSKRAGELDARAERALEELLEREPNEERVVLAAAERLIRLGRLGEAGRLLERLPSESREVGRGCVVSGLLALREGRGDDAIATWREGLLASRGSDAELTWWLAFCQLERGRLEEAHDLIDQYRRLIGGRNPNSAWLFLDGLRALTSNRPKEAIRILGTAKLHALPDLEGLIFRALARAHRSIRNEAVSLDLYRKAIEADPTSTVARMEYHDLLRSYRPGDAEKFLRLELDRFGDDPDLLAALGRAERERQRARPADQRSWAELTRLAERIRNAAPEYAAAAELDARVMIETGRASEAVRRLEATLGRHPGDAVLWATYADALVRVGELDRAITALDEARRPERAGDLAALRTAQARLLDAVGRTDEARAVLVNDLDRLRPEDRMAPWMSLGDLELARGRPADALRAYHQGVQLAPDDPQARLVVLDLALTEPTGIDGADDLVRESIEALERIEGSRGADVLLGRAMLLIDRAGKSDVEARETSLAEAEALLKSAREQLLDTRYSDILEGRLMELRDRPEAAVAAYERVERAQPGEVVETRLMSLYARLGRDVDLARLRRERLAAAPSLDRFAAEASSRLGLAERAEALARRVVEGAPDDPDTRLWQAQLLNSLGKPEEARASLDQLVAERPDRLGPRLVQLAFLVGTGQRDQADAAVEAIIENVRGLERPELVHAQCWHVAGRPDRASAAFERAVERWPDDDRVVRAAADYFEGTGNADRARAILREAWAAHPSWRWAADALALLLSDHAGDLPAWREAWSLVAPVDGQTDSPEDLFARGVVLSRSPDPDQARDAPALLERLLEGLPSHLPAAARTREVLARIYLREQAPAKAETLAAANVEQRPDARSIRLYVEALIATGKLDEADRQVDRLAASTAESARAEAPRLRARVLGARGRPADAAAVIEGAIGPLLDRPDGETIGREAVRDLLAMGQAASAGRVADLLARRWPGAAVVAATVAASQGRHDEALERFRQAVATADAEGLREIARNLLALAVASGSRREVLNQADAILTAAVARAPDDPRLVVRTAHLRHLQGRYEDEVALYRKALGLNPADRGFLNNLAWTLSEELRRPEEGLEWINEAFRVVPRSPRLLDTRGVILTRLGRYPEAIRDLEAATAATPLTNDAGPPRPRLPRGRRGRAIPDRPRPRQAGRARPRTARTRRARRAG